MPLDPEIAQLLAVVETGTPMIEQSPEEARASFKTLAVGLRPAESVVPFADIKATTVQGGQGRLDARVYRPEGKGPFPVVALFHGGGFVIGDLDTHDNLARSIAVACRAVVVSVDYRLAPEHPFPAATDDAVAATRDLMARLGEYDGNGTLAVAGDSAGGNLAAVAAQQVPGVAAQFLIYPFTDGEGDYPSRVENGQGYFIDTEMMLWFAAHYAPDGDGADPQVSPLRGVRSGLPPAVVVTAEFDPLRDEGEAYAAALQDAGVEARVRRYDGLIHGFMDMDGFSASARSARDDSIALFADLLAGI